MGKQELNPAWHTLNSIVPSPASCVIREKRCQLPRAWVALPYGTVGGCSSPGFQHGQAWLTPGSFPHSGDPNSWPLQSSGVSSAFYASHSQFRTLLSQGHTAWPPRRSEIWAGHPDHTTLAFWMHLKSATPARSATSWSSSQLSFSVFWTAEHYKTHPEDNVLRLTPFCSRELWGSFLKAKAFCNFEVAKGEVHLDTSITNTKVSLAYFWLSHVYVSVSPS